MHLGTRSLTLTVAGVSRTGDVSDCRIVSGPMPENRRKLCGPDREYRLQGVAAQDPVEGSLWDLVWSSGIDTQAEVEIRPAGGVIASSAQPVFLGTVTVTEPDGNLLGGEADPSVGGRFTFEIDWIFTAKPTLARA